MNTEKPYCPTCHRRLHKLRAAATQPCLVCGKPVEGMGVGRPRRLHPECRAPRRKAKEGEVRP